MSKIILVDALRYGDVSSDLADRDEHAHLLDDSVLCIHCGQKYGLYVAGDIGVEVDLKAIHINPHKKLIAAAIDSEHESGHLTKKFRTDGTTVTTSHY